MVRCRDFLLPEWMMTGRTERTGVEDEKMDVMEGMAGKWECGGEKENIIKNNKKFGMLDSHVLTL